MKWKPDVLILLVSICSLMAWNTLRAEPRKLWIFLHGRPYLHSDRLPSPQSGGFSIDSVKRREIRSTSNWNASDFPVDPSYIKALRSSGARILVESRWLNAVSILCDSPCQKDLAKLPFVVGIQPVLTYHRANEPVARIFMPENQSTPDAISGLKYGNSKDQLNQLKVPVAHQRGFAGQGEIVAIFDTGFRKDHIAFKNKVIVGQRDFVFDDNNVQNGGATDTHGTSTWSCVGGEAPGVLYGPAYQAKFILACTEDIRSETKVEEDNWVAAFEWADRLGATVISSSLGYNSWYGPSDYNGTTAITSRVASTATKKGIVVVNSAGNEGPGSPSLGAPADAKNILAVGAIGANGLIAGFSSRGPTADGRIKPEVVARGVQTWVAESIAPASFGRGSGTSFACPLTAGCAAVLLSAHPDWTPLQARQAIIDTANQHDHPDNTYGWGVVNLALALDALPDGAVVIDHTPLKNSSNTTAPYPVIARIRAQRGLNNSQLFLFWKREGSPAFAKILLQSVPNTPDKFQASIPAQPKGTTIIYYLTAKDTMGKATKDPFKAPQNVFQFEIH